MLMHNFPRQRQPQAQATLTTTARLVHTIEAVKNLFLILITNATALVLNRNEQTLLAFASVKINCRIRRRIFKSIIQDNDQHPVQGCLIAPQLQMLVNAALQGNPLFLGQQRQLRGNLLAQITQIDLL